MPNFRVLTDKRRTPGAPPNPSLGSTTLHASCLWGSSLLNIDNILKDGRPNQFHSFNNVPWGFFVQHFSG